jgi:pyruvate/2-oxoacid:ferredoxin oxidoreductase beta subunit
MSETIQATQPALTAKDFQTDQEVRWCPGCGDYSILAQVQKVMPTLGIPTLFMVGRQPLHKWIKGNASRIKCMDCYG